LFFARWNFPSARRIRAAVTNRLGKSYPSRVIFASHLFFFISVLSLEAALRDMRLYMYSSLLPLSYAGWENQYLLDI
jgi:hypothetical protein